MKLTIMHDFQTASPGDELIAAVEQCIRHTLKAEQFPYDACIELNWVDNNTIHQANRTLRGVDRATDVLSIPFLELDGDGALVVEDSDFYNGTVQLGEIMLSLERAREQAEEYGHSLKREVCFLAVHSVLHLLGYDHELGEQEERDMFARQEELLAQLNITR